MIYYTYTGQRNGTERPTRMKMDFYIKHYFSIPWANRVSFGDSSGFLYSKSPVIHVWCFHPTWTYPLKFRKHDLQAPFVSTWYIILGWRFQDIFANSICLFLINVCVYNAMCRVKQRRERLTYVYSSPIMISTINITILSEVLYLKQLWIIHSRSPQTPG